MRCLNIHWQAPSPWGEGHGGVETVMNQMAQGFGNELVFFVFAKEISQVEFDGVKAYRTPLLKPRESLNEQEQKGLEDYTKMIIQKESIDCILFENMHISPLPQIEGRDPYFVNTLDQVRPILRVTKDLPKVLRIHNVYFTAGNRKQIRELFEAGTKLVAVSPKVKEDVYKLLLGSVSREDIQVLYTGFDVQRALADRNYHDTLSSLFNEIQKKGAPKVEENDFVIINLSRLTKRKNAALPIQGMVQLKKLQEKDRGAFEAIKLLFLAAPSITEEEKQLEAHLKGIIEKNGLSESTFFGVHTLSYDQLNALYRRAQLVSYVTFAEPWGLVPLEAGLQGTPCIVGEGSGVSAYIQKFEAGWIVDPVNPDPNLTAPMQWAAVVDGVFSNRFLLDRTSKNAFEMATQPEFTKEKMVEGMKSILSTQS